MAERYPLAWPPGRPRTKVRKSGTYKSGGRDITIGAALSRLNDEIERLGGRYALLSSNYETRLDGSMILNRGAPSDPGVCVYFQLKDKPFAMACDTFSEVAQNIAALAAHIEATRKIGRIGVATSAETLQAFSALPAPDHVLPNRRPWRQVLGFTDHWPVGYSTDPVGDVQRRYRARSIEAPNEAAQSDLNVARDAALAELKK